MPDDKKPPQTTPAPEMTAAQAIGQLADQLLARQPADPANMGLSEAKRRALTEMPEGLRYRVIHGRGAETEATFLLIVSESRDPKFTHGRVVRLEQYKHPEGIYVYQSTGGKCPDGMPILDEREGMPVLGTNGEPVQAVSPMFKQWRWENYYQADLRTHVGKPLTAAMCASPDGLKTPWETAPYFGSDEAAAE